MATETVETADKKVEAPERVYLDRFWGNYREHSCQFSYEKKFEDDIPYIHADAPTTRQRAERAAQAVINEFQGCMLVPDGYTHEMFYLRRLADIIAAEFEK